MKLDKFQLWRKILPFLYVFVVVHFLKDVTQDILKISTPLDLLGNIQEDLSQLPEIVQRLFFGVGVGSFIAEIFLLIAIPVVIKRKEITPLEKGVIFVFLSLVIYFAVAALLDPRLWLVKG